MRTKRLRLAGVLLCLGRMGTCRLRRLTAFGLAPLTVSDRVTVVSWDLVSLGQAP